MNENQQTVSFTIYTSTNPQSKIFTIKNKKIKKYTSSQMYKGTARRVTIPFKDFGEELSNAPSKEAFGYGLHNRKYPSLVSIVIKGTERPQYDFISRSKDYFKYRKRPGILMLDYDPSKYNPRPIVTPDDLIEILISIDPNIDTSARVVRGSVSSCVHLVGEKSRKGKGKGFHIYIPVKDATDIPRYGKLLFDNLWLNGYGFITIYGNGEPHGRSLIDAAVFSGERLDFVGQPIIQDDGIQYAEPKVEYVRGMYLDTNELQDLTTVQIVERDNLIQEAKDKPEIKLITKQVKAKYKEDRIDTTMKTANVSRAEATKHVERELKSRSKFNKLWGIAVLEFSEGNVTVAEVLKNHDAYDKRALADPYRGREHGGTAAMFWWNDGKPVIHSFAHGEETVFYLYEREPLRLIDDIDQYYDEPDYSRTKEETIRLMKNVVKKWMSNPDGYFSIAAPAGIGKTRVILENVVTEAAKGKFIEIYVPTHKLAKEMKMDLLSQEFNPNLKVIVIRGRTNVENGDAACNKSELISVIQDYKYNIYKNVCKDCKFFSGPKQCHYFSQYNNMPQVRIFTHQHLALPRGPLDGKYPDVAVIDESFFTPMINNCSTSFNVIKGRIKNKQLANLIVDALSNDDPLLFMLRKEFGLNVLDELDEAAKLVYPILPEVESTTEASAIKVKLVDSIKEKLNLAAMLNQLKAEIKKFPRRKISTAVRFVKGNSSEPDENNVIIASRHELVRFTKKECEDEDDENVPVLCIDADFCPRRLSDLRLNTPLSS